ncbi:MAG: RlmI/RlmK family 23S rRNA methyltransferase, partial [Gammaproteobacteria bacterium]|nr:RlmI/RlmK family 23S rRNA methyltransferase [Gammaproteobacteria bacterium]
MLPQLFLKKNEERRLLAGHLWVFSNEIDNKQSPLKNFSAGQHVNVCRQDGRILGSAYVNPHSLISARIYSARANQILDQVFIQEKLQAALDLRESLYPTAFYRLCHSEGDFLPGLVVDRF